MSGRIRDLFLPTVASILGPPVLKALGATWSARRYGFDPFVARRDGAEGRYIISLWHASLLPLAYLHRDEHATVLVSRHGDGELIVRILRRLNFRVARGSTTRGGAAALRQLVRVASQGTGDLAITPDGPKGPARKAQPGIAYLSALTRLPILPLALVAHRAWQLNSWDRFQIPRPFTRIAVVAGEPLPVARDALRTPAPYLDRFEHEMAQAEQRAREHLAEAW